MCPPRRRRRVRQCALHEVSFCLRRSVLCRLVLRPRRSPATAADLGPSRMMPVKAPALCPSTGAAWYAGLNPRRRLRRCQRRRVRRPAWLQLAVGPDWVFGVETDIQYSGQDDNFFVGATSVSNELDWFGTFRGRIGWAVWDRWLPYFTGGLAYGGRTIKVGGPRRRRHRDRLGDRRRRRLRHHAELERTPRIPARLAPGLLGVVPGRRRGQLGPPRQRHHPRRGQLPLLPPDRSDIRLQKRPASRRPFAFPANSATACP